MLVIKNIKLRNNEISNFKKVRGLVTHFDLLKPSSLDRYVANKPNINN